MACGYCIVACASFFSCRRRGDETVITVEGVVVLFHQVLRMVEESLSYLQHRFGLPGYAPLAFDDQRLFAR